MTLPYKEGTWIAVPLRNHAGYGVGRIARHSMNGCILVYLFGPRRLTIPTLDEVEDLDPAAAIRVARMGDLGIIQGEWPIIGNSIKWSREQWPIPRFVRRDELGKVAWLVEYSDDNPLEIVSEKRIPYSTTSYQRDSLLGSGAAEIVMTRLLT